MLKDIVIKGAKVNNLKNVDLVIPREKLVVFTGVSGSGKSTLAFDTIFAEGQRRYIESLSSYARMFLGQMSKPDVDSIDGLSPAKKNTGAVVVDEDDEDIELDTDTDEDDDTDGDGDSDSVDDTDGDEDSDDSEDTDGDEDAEDPEEKPTVSSAMTLIDIFRNRRATIPRKNGGDKKG